MSNALKSALAGGLTAILLYMVLPSKVEIERVREELRPIAIPEVRVPEVKLPEVVRVRFAPYERVGFMRFTSLSKSYRPISNVQKRVDGVGIYYPVTTYIGGNLVDQSGLEPIEVCNNVECGITLAPSMALVFNINDLSKVYIKNNSDKNVILEVMYYEA